MTRDTGHVTRDQETSGDNNWHQVRHITTSYSGKVTIISSSSDNETFCIHFTLSYYFTEIANNNSQAKGNHGLSTNYTVCLLFPNKWGGRFKYFKLYFALEGLLTT